MASSMTWIQSWLIPILTSIIIFVLLFFIIYYVCWERKKKPQFYALEESGLKKKSRSSLRNLAFFRKLSISTKDDDFTTKNLSSISSSKNRNNDDSALMDSIEITKSFDNLVLQLENDPFETPIRDELRSCNSTDSLMTFYSIHNNLRKTSFVSVISDDNNLDSVGECSRANK